MHFLPEALSLVSQSKLLFFLFVFAIHQGVPLSELLPWRHTSTCVAYQNAYFILSVSLGAELRIQ